MGGARWIKVLGGAFAIVAGASMLSYATSWQSGQTAGSAAPGIAAALGAGWLWGTMYIPYRKAYISGMNPLSFVTVFTFGELGAVSLLALILDDVFNVSRRNCTTRSRPCSALSGRFLLGAG